jgi:hypothetical protein
MLEKDKSYSSRSKRSRNDSLLSQDNIVAEAAERQTHSTYVSSDEGAKMKNSSAIRRFSTQMKSIISNLNKSSVLTSSGSSNNLSPLMVNENLNGIKMIDGENQK